MDLAGGAWQPCCRRLSASGCNGTDQPWAAWRHSGDLQRLEASLFIDRNDSRDRVPVAIKPRQSHDAHFPGAADAGLPHAITAGAQHPGMVGSENNAGQSSTIASGPVANKLRSSIISSAYPERRRFRRTCRRVHYTQKPYVQSPSYCPGHPLGAALDARRPTAGLDRSDHRRPRAASGTHTGILWRSPGATAGARPSARRCSSGNLRPCGAGPDQGRPASMPSARTGPRAAV